MRSASSLQRTILYTKPYSQLLELTQINPAFEVLAVDQGFWAEKALLDFNVPRWYWSLTSNFLSPPQNYLYFLSQKGLIAESEQVLDLNVCFSRAAGMGNEELMNFFSDRLRQLGIQPDFKRAFDRALVGGHLQIVENLTPLVELKRDSAVALACSSGNIELVKYILSFPGQRSNKFLFNLALSRALAISYDFYLQVKELLGTRPVRVLSHIVTKILSTGSLQSFEEIYPQINSNEAIENALTGAFISGNSDLIDRVLVSFPLPDQLVLRSRRKSLAYSGDIRQYATLLRQSPVSLDELLSEAEMAFENSSYSILSLILASFQFGPAQIRGLEDLFFLASERGDLGLIYYISQKVDATPFFRDQLEFAVNSGSLPLARFFAIHLTDPTALRGLESKNLQSLEIIREALKQ